MNRILYFILRSAYSTWRLATPPSAEGSTPGETDNDDLGGDGGDFNY